jgi:para-aminobenzoate synthetase/4-amino-4-deoxychorismate lyase
MGHGVADGRIRIDVAPNEEPRVQMTPNVERSNPVLRPVLVAGGIGAHKWRDRTLLQAHEDDDPGTLPLLIDADGIVLETSRTGIVVQAPDGTRWTPPHDGRILPSTTVKVSGARPRRLSIADLHAASAIYVASSLRGLKPARLQAVSNAARSSSRMTPGTSTPARWSSTTV